VSAFTPPDNGPMDPAKYAELVQLKQAQMSEKSAAVVEIDS